MKKEDLYNSLQYIDDDLLDRSDKAIIKKTKSFKLENLAILAASLVVISGLVIVIANSNSGKDYSNNAAPPMYDSSSGISNDSVGNDTVNSAKPSIDNSKDKETSGSQDEAAFYKMPEDTDLDFWVTDDVSGFDFGEYTKLDGLMGGDMYLGKEYEPVISDGGSKSAPKKSVTYIVTAYPDYSSEGRNITGIEITDPNVRVMGLTVLDDNEKISEKLKGLGYEIEAVGDTGNRFSAKQGKLTIVYGLGKILVNVEVTNELGITF